MVGAQGGTTAFGLVVGSQTEVAARAGEAASEQGQPLGSWEHFPFLCEVATDGNLNNSLDEGEMEADEVEESDGNHGLWREWQ